MNQAVVRRKIAGWGRTMRRVIVPDTIKLQATMDRIAANGTTKLTAVDYFLNGTTVAMPHCKNSRIK